MKKSNIPKSWVYSEIKEIGIIKTGNTPSKKDNANYGSFIPFIKPPQLQNNEIANAKEYLSEKGLKSGRHLKANSVLVSCIGNLGRVAFNKIDVAFNQQINAIEFDSQFFNSKFYFYYFQTLTKWLYSVASATTLPIVNKSKFERAPILIPPLNEQHRIVEKIEELFTKLDAAVTELKNVKKQLKRYRQSVLKAAFEGKLTEDDDWKWIKLNTELEVKDGTHDTPKYEENGIPFITQKNIKNGKFLFENFKRINENDHDKFYKRSNVAQNDIIISMIGANRGMSCIVDIDAVFSIKNVGLVKADFQKFLPKFLDYYFKSNHGQSSILSKSKGGAQQFIGLTELRNWEVPHPLIDIQENIVEEIESRLSVADKIEEEIDKNLKRTEQLRQSILKKAFEGKLVPQDPNDEPAEKLLERITKEKNKSEVN